MEKHTMKEKNTMTERRQLNTREAADYLRDLGSPGAVVCTLANWRHLGRGPRYYRVGRSIVYRVSDLDLFASGTPVETSDSLAIGSRT